MTMRTSTAFILATLTAWTLASIARADGYPEASLDQASEEALEELKKPDRLVGMSEVELEAEYRWTKAMARLLLPHIKNVGEHCWWAIDHQRHAGRVARFRGCLEQALREYATAMDFVTELAPFDRASEGAVLRDLGETYVLIGAYHEAAECFRLASATAAQCEEPGFVGSSPDLDALADIAVRQRVYEQAVKLQEQATAVREAAVPGFLGEHPQLAEIDRSIPWPDLVRDPRVEAILQTVDVDGRNGCSDRREGYYRLAVVYRQAGRLDEAEHALETAELTPWAQLGLYQRNLDLPVDREWALLALARRQWRDALSLANRCLEHYHDIIGPLDRLELLDLVSRALERLGDLEAALDTLKEAIDIVEKRRANLIADENKHLFVAGYAGLY